MDLRMLFLLFSNADLQFADKELIWKVYTNEEALPTTQQIELINKKKFAKASLNENIEAFIVYVAFFILEMTIHLARKA